MRICASCGGSGNDGGAQELSCSACEGRGEVNEGPNYYLIVLAIAFTLMMAFYFSYEVECWSTQDGEPIHLDKPECK